MTRFGGMVAGRAGHARQRRRRTQAIPSPPAENGHTRPEDMPTRREHDPEEER